MFIVERGAQIMTFVNAVLDAVIAIAGGGAGGVPGLIETALATALPVLIGFLAALLSIGGLADKVKKLFQSLSKPVMKAVDWIVGKIAGLAKKLWGKMKAKFTGKKGTDGKQRELTVKEKGKIAKKAANEGFRKACDVPVDGIQGAISGVYAKWQGKGLKSLSVISKGDDSFTVKASVNPEVTADSSAAVKLSPEKIPIEKAAAESFASSTTVASGAFSADSSPELSGLMKSGAPLKDLKMADSQKEAHAEEQVVNKFHGGWNERVGAIADKLKPVHRSMKFFEIARMVIHVTKSSCINCASHIVRFKRELHKRAKSVDVSMKFAITYQGKQEVSKSNLKEFDRLIPMFLKTAQLKPGKGSGRTWGLSSLFGSKKEKVSVTSGKDAGRAGLAILYRQGVNVDTMSLDDVEGEGTKKVLFEERKERLENDLRRVKDEIDQIRAGS